MRYPHVFSKGAVKRANSSRYATLRVVTKSYFSECSGFFARSSLREWKKCVFLSSSFLQNSSAACTFFPTESINVMSSISPKNILRGMPGNPPPVQTSATFPESFPNLLNIRLSTKCFSMTQVSSRMAERLTWEFFSRNICKKISNFFSCSGVREMEYFLKVRCIVECGFGRNIWGNEEKTRKIN